MRGLPRTLLLVESVWAFGSGLFLPIFAIFSTQVGGDITDAGFAAAIFIAVTSLLEYPIGILLDRMVAHHKQKWFLVADYALEAIVFFGYMFVTNKFELFALQTVLGVANALGDPAWEALYDESTPKRRAGSFWARSHLFIGMATAFAIALGGMLAEQYGFAPIFFAGGCISLVAAILTIIRIKE
jgi:MFS family permease